MKKESLFCLLHLFASLLSLSHSHYLPFSLSLSLFISQYFLYSPSSFTQFSLLLCVSHSIIMILCISLCLSSPLSTLFSPSCMGFPSVLLYFPLVCQILFLSLPHAQIRSLNLIYFSLSLSSNLMNPLVLSHIVFLSDKCLFYLLLSSLSPSYSLFDSISLPSLFSQYQTTSCLLSLLLSLPLCI